MFIQSIHSLDSLLHFLAYLLLSFSLILSFQLYSLFKSLLDIESNYILQHDTFCFFILESKYGVESLTQFPSRDSPWLLQILSE